jgi:hypothetical protein
MESARQAWCRGRLCVHRSSPEAWVFEIIELFNVAMLAHQAWCILFNPEALSFKIFKVV